MSTVTTLLAPLMQLSITAVETPRERHWRTVLNGDKPTRKTAAMYARERAMAASKKDMKKSKKSKISKKTVFSKSLAKHVQSLVPGLSFDI